jgi:serine/threonine protein kinase
VTAQSSTCSGTGPSTSKSSNPSQTLASTYNPHSYPTSGSNGLSGSTTSVDDLANGRYQVFGRLGRGGQGVVEKAYDTQDGQTYALKIYTSRDATQYNERASNFNREVGIMNRLSMSSYVVTMVRYHFSPQTLKHAFVLSPIANGRSLLHRLRDQFDAPQSATFSAQFTRQTLLDLAEGLRDIHRASIRHKDIKPGNVLIHNERILYTDFGLALDFFGYSTDETDGPMPEYDCTRAYAAHETFDGAKRNRKSDVFCLGCVWFEIVCGRATAITREVGWASETPFGDYFERYCEMEKNQRIERKLQEIASDRRLTELHSYVPWIRLMMGRQRDARPEASEIVIALAN